MIKVATCKMRATTNNAARREVDMRNARDAKRCAFRLLATVLIGLRTAVVGKTAAYLVKLSALRHCTHRCMP